MQIILGTILITESSSQALKHERQDELSTLTIPYSRRGMLFQWAVLRKPILPGNVYGFPAMMERLTQGF